MFYNIVKSIVGIILKPFYPIQVHGIENISSNGKLLLCSNHVSKLDPILITIGFPRQINWMAKSELFKNKILSFIITKLKAFPVNRKETDINAIKNALRVLKKNEVLGIFPEGTRVKEFNLKNAKSGAALISLRSRAPILPVYIEEDYKMFTKVNIYIGKPIRYYETFNKKVSPEDYKFISEDLLKRIYSLKI
ncbi:MAG TPA: lysophospholipid acyltransferase family protein [Tissierellaceae bacterium]|nr:lysophospholipid acyltransferase family protein [Tissierellaceae bacterium]